MKRLKRNAVFVAAVLFSMTLAACSSETIEDAKQNAVDDMEFVKENGAGGDKYNEELAEDVIDGLKGEDKGNGQGSSGNSNSGVFALGDVAELTGMNENNSDQTIQVVFKEWGTCKSSLGNFLTYFSYEIENVGDVACEIGNGMFDVYADNYQVGQYGLMDDIVPLANLSPGRKVSGSVYVELDPATVSNIEIECGNVKWVIKQSSGDESGAGISSDKFTGMSDIDGLELAGKYVSYMEATASISMYSSPEGDEAGNAELIGMSYGYEGVLKVVDNNVYQLVTSDGSEVLLGFERGEDGISFELYINGDFMDTYYMTEHYES